MITAGAGVLAGLLYSLSPLTVWFFAVLPLLWWFASRDLSDRERRWLLIVLAVAVSLRVAALAGLFLTADPSQPYANVFGDEEFFKRRTLWLRNIGLGIPVHGADMIYAYDETGRSSYLWVLAYLQALVGAAPYGVHLFNTALYLFAVLLLYRVVRQSYGGLAALGGLVLLLFLPSLFTWSISALKEPLYILVCAIELACAVYIVRARRWWQRVLALIAVVLAAQALQSLRFGGLGLAAAGTVGGLALGILLTRPRVFIASLVARAPPAGGPARAAGRSGTGDGSGVDGGISALGTSRHARLYLHVDRAAVFQRSTVGAGDVAARSRALRDSCLCGLFHGAIALED